MRHIFANFEEVPDIRHEVMMESKNQNEDEDNFRPGYVLIRPPVRSTWLLHKDLIIFRS